MILLHIVLDTDVGYDHVYSPLNLLILFEISGVEKIVCHLKAKDIPIAVATGNSQFEFSLKQKGNPEFFNLFHHAVGTLGMYSAL